MHCLSVMSQVRFPLLCCEQISAWFSCFRGQNWAICHIWQPSRYSSKGPINSIWNVMEVFSLCTVLICFIKEGLDIGCTSKLPQASYSNVMHPNTLRLFYFVSVLSTQLSMQMINYFVCLLVFLVFKDKQTCDSCSINVLLKSYETVEWWAKPSPNSVTSWIIFPTCFRAWSQRCLHQQRQQ